MEILKIEPPALEIPTGRKALRQFLNDQVETLPKDEPGVYLFRDVIGNIIYIGKAKRLKTRVQSYFRPNHHDGRGQFRAIVRNTVTIHYIVTDTEVEALILEATLIKKHKPRYNVTLKDDKKYPFLKITKEAYPRIVVTRDYVKDGSRYLGPFSDVKAMRMTLGTVHKHLRIRQCDPVLPKSSVTRCLDYEMKRCDAPCENLISREDYNELVNKAVLFLTGRHRQLIEELTDKMKVSSQNLQFEVAAVFRDRINAFQQIMNRQKMVGTDLSDWDSIAIAQDDVDACAVVFQVRGGKVIGRQHFFLSVALSLPPRDIFESFLKQYYETTTFIPPEISVGEFSEEDSAILGGKEESDLELILDWLRDKSEGLVEVKNPKRGEKKQLLKLANLNAQKLLDERNIQRENRRSQPSKMVTSLQRDLQLSKLPNHIECIDISTLQGTSSVASLVTFVNGKPKKSDYRHFKIQNIQSQDDFAMIHQVVCRRFKRLLEENQDLPDLLVIDGGKGQLSSALQALKELGVENQPIISLAKRLEEVYVPGFQSAQNLPKSSSSLRLLRAMRDESHRFAITYHRKVRSKNSFSSSLDNVNGIGEQRRKRLLSHFGSLKKLSEANPDEIAQVPGISHSLAKSILQSLSL
jgi:excinuclease ABC subunit C